MCEHESSAFLLLGFFGSCLGCVNAKCGVEGRGGRRGGGWEVEIPLGVWKRGRYKSENAGKRGSKRGGFLEGSENRSENGEQWDGSSDEGDLSQCMGKEWQKWVRRISQSAGENGETQQGFLGE